MASSDRIYRRVHDVGNAFVSLAQALNTSPQHAEQLAPEEVEEELDRFKIWAGNVAAHETGWASLEDRLCDASHLKDEVNNVLSTLEQSLSRAIAITQGEVAPWDALPDSDDDDAASDTSSRADSDTELIQLLSSVKSSITCLFRLSMAIRDPAPGDRLQSIITVDKPHFEKDDINHVVAKLPDCPYYLAGRLGRAISARRQYLIHREQHHKFFSNRQDHIGLEPPRTEYTSNSTEATRSKGQSPGALEEHDSVSETSYATSVNASIRVPPLPKEARLNKHYKCPLCYRVVSIHTPEAWKQHVYRDLRPYSCTFEQCPMEDHLFASRHEWYIHELEAHRSTWQCIPGCTISFLHANEYDDHVSTAHPELNSSPVLAALRSTARKSGSTTVQAQCPMCTIQMPVWVLQGHVGRHQEEMALFALPLNLEETENSTDEMSSSTSFFPRESESAVESASFPSSSDGWLNAKAVALFDFEKENDNELSIIQGHHLWTAYRRGQGWVFAQDLKTGKSGFVPEAYLRPLRDVAEDVESVAVNTVVEASIERTPSAAPKITDRVIDRERRRKLIEDEKKRRDKEEETLLLDEQILKAEEQAKKKVSFRKRVSFITPLSEGLQPDETILHGIEPSEGVLKGDAWLQEQGHKSPGHPELRDIPQVNKTSFEQGDSHKWNEVVAEHSAEVVNRSSSTENTSVDIDEGISVDTDVPREVSGGFSHTDYRPAFPRYMWYCCSCSNGPYDTISCFYCGHRKAGCCVVVRSDVKVH